MAMFAGYRKRNLTSNLPRAKKNGVCEFLILDLVNIYAYTIMLLNECFHIGPVTGPRSVVLA